MPRGTHGKAELTRSGPAAKWTNWSQKRSAYLFVTRDGTPMSGEIFRQIIVRLRRRLKLPDFVNCEGIKDAGYEIAQEVDSKRAPWIPDHKTGKKDRNILRRADSPRTRQCREAIETHFFGGKK